MSDIADILLAEATRAKLVDDLTALAKKTIAEKKGVKATLVRASVKTLNGIKPNFLHKMMNKLSPDVVSAVTPYIEKWDKAGPLGDIFVANKDAVTESLLKAIDDRTSQSRNIVQSTYRKIRGSVGAYIMDTLPEFGDIFTKHLQQ